MRYSDYNKMTWNKEILDNLKNYMGIDTLINSSVVMSESNYQKMKDK
jgi:hypothetical protein